ncbi:MAG: hypothetical protein WD360_03480 [Nitriliruptoraceae bacterium]
MADTFNLSTATDAIARDLNELRDRVLHDPTTRAVSAVAAVGAVVGVMGIAGLIVRAVVRKRRLISNVMLLATTVAALTRLRERALLSSLVRPTDGPPLPPSPAAPTA